MATHLASPQVMTTLLRLARVDTGAPANDGWLAGSLEGGGVDVVGECDVACGTAGLPNRRDKSPGLPEGRPMRQIMNLAQELTAMVTSNSTRASSTSAERHKS